MKGPHKSSIMISGQHLQSAFSARTTPWSSFPGNQQAFLRDGVHVLCLCAVVGEDGLVLGVLPGQQKLLLQLLIRVERLQMHLTTKHAGGLLQGFFCHLL